MKKLYRIKPCLFEWFYTLLLLFCSMTIHAQDIEITQIEHNISIDGILEDSWFQCDSIDTFFQAEPENGALSSQKTVARIAQDATNLYISVVCYFDPSTPLAANIQQRDQLSPADDLISVILDTYNDNRTAINFSVNTLGTLSDAKITDDGKDYNSLWDTQWNAKVKVYQNYYIAEIQIPFKSLPYKPGSTQWGINFGRAIPSNNELSWSSSVTENMKISQIGNLKLTTPESHQHQLTVFPYLSARYGNNINNINSDFDFEIGGDVTYQYRSNFKANLTYNPDFATVEGDKEQINLTPWELKFPEKRIFFQDGNELFGTRIQTFYSRRIGDMKYGGKIIGKSGKYQYNLLTARTKENTISNDPEAWHNTARVKRDLFRSSTIGMTYADKLTDTASYRSFSLDYVLNLGNTWKLTGQYVASTPGDLASHSAWFVRFARENMIYHYHIRYSNVGENFKDNVNQTGYVRDDDRHELDSDVSYKFWFTNKMAKYLYLSGKNNVYWSKEKVLRSWYLTYGGRLYLDNRFSFDLDYNNEYKLFEKEYHNHYYKGKIGYNTEEESYASLAYRTGHHYDRDFNMLEFRSKFQLFKKLSVRYELNHINYKPDLNNNSTLINVLGLDYFFTNDLWIRVFAQNNTAYKKNYLYGLVGWRFKPPFGALYFIVNTDRFVNSNQIKINNEVVFLKLTYPITVM